MKIDFLFSIIERDREKFKKVLLTENIHGIGGNFASERDGNAMEFVLTYFESDIVLVTDDSVAGYALKFKTNVTVFQIVDAQEPGNFSIENTVSGTRVHKRFCEVTLFAPAHKKWNDRHQTIPVERVGELHAPPMNLRSVLGIRVISGMVKPFS